MRLFIAVNIPDTIKQKVMRVMDELPHDWRIKAVAPQNMHYTLRFLGEIPDTDVARIISALSGIKFQPFEIKVEGIGVFPNEKYVRVIWLGAKDAERLKRLAEDIENAIKHLGYRQDRPFSPHLTIARVRGKIDVKKLLERHKDTLFGAFVVSEFCLVKSTLTPNGPVYENVKCFLSENE